VLSGFANRAFPFAVVVSITFDDGLQNQYGLGFLRALKPHHMNGTFYDVSGLNNVDPQHMTWPEITALNNGQTKSAATRGTTSISRPRPISAPRSPRPARTGRT
jgi:hypothetical protein